MKKTQSVEENIHNFLTAGFSPKFGKVKSSFASSKLWQKFNDIGTELWLDTGNINDISKYWTQQFTSLTTNNTLLNKEVQSGRYDRLVADIAKILNKYDLDENQRKLEFAFALNAYHALRLVEKFDAYVSVEEHTDLANDIEAAVIYARRYYAICPERFIVKIPFTPAGLLATRQAVNEGIPVNSTLGFSARQNYIITRIAKPNFVNVFLGRLNSFTADNGLGNGLYIGEKATIASHLAVSEIRRTHSTPTRQIAASLRDGQQVPNLAGVSVFTMPPKVAGEFLDMNIPPEQITDQTGQNYEPGITDKKNIDRFGFNCLWEITDELINCVDKLEQENLDTYTADNIVDFFHENNCGDMMVRWSEKEIKTSIEEGKIPRLENWRQALTDKIVGLDSLMNLAGLCSFASDQNAMDERVKSVLQSV